MPKMLGGVNSKRGGSKLPIPLAVLADLSALRAFFHRGIKRWNMGGIGIYSHSIPIPFPPTGIEPEQAYSIGILAAILIPLEQVE